MGELEQLNEYWRKKTDELNENFQIKLKEIQNEYEKRLKEYERELNRYKDQVRELGIAYEKNIEDLKHEHLKAIEKLNEEHKKEFEKLKRRINADERKLKELIEEENKFLEEQQKTKQEIDRYLENIKTENSEREKALHDDLIRTKNRMLNTIDSAKQIDVDLNRHSDGRISSIIERIENNSIQSGSDKYYSYTEMLIYRVNLNEIIPEINIAIEIAEENMKQESALNAIENKIKEFVSESDGEFEITRDFSRSLWVERKCKITSRHKDVIDLRFNHNGIYITLSNDRYCDRDVLAEKQYNTQELFNGLFDHELHKNVNKIMDSRPLAPVNPINNPNGMNDVHHVTDKIN